MLSKMTLVGLNEFSEGHLWDNLDLPEGVDSEVFINEVIKHGGEFSLLYPDLDFMKYQIGAWSKKWKRTFERWITADTFEYEALYNLDVSSTRTEEGHNAASGSKTTSGNTSGTNSETTTEASDGASTNEHSKAVYDSGTYQPTEKDVGENHVTSSGSKSVTLSGTSSGTESTTDNSNHTITITEIRQGNQGVTMSQEMLDAERNVWMWNIYNHMADLFVNEYCICLYT